MKDKIAILIKWLRLSFLFTATTPFLFTL